MLNVAVIGCGKHFEYFHLKSFKRLSKNFNIHGIYDVDYKRSKKIQKKYRIKKCYKNLIELYKDKEINVVDICSPPYFHFKQIIQALKHDKHVMVEKPMVLTKNQLVEIIKFKKKRLKITCLLHSRFRDETNILKQFITKNTQKFGKLVKIKCKANYINNIPKQHNYSFTNKKISGGGPMIDHGSHLIDLIIYLFKFKNFSKHHSFLFENFVIKKNNRFNIEESGFTTFVFDKNILVNFESSYLDNIKEEKFEIELIFKNGYINWPKLEYFFRKEKIIKKIKIKKKSFEINNQFKHFYNSVKYNKKPL